MSAPDVEDIEQRFQIASRATNPLAGRVRRYRRASVTAAIPDDERPHCRHSGNIVRPQARMSGEAVRKHQRRAVLCSMDFVVDLNAVMVEVGHVFLSYAVAPTPLVRTVSGGTFEDCGDALTAANAHCLQPVAAFASLQFM